MAATVITDNRNSHQNEIIEEEKSSEVESDKCVSEEPDDKPQIEEANGHKPDLWSILYTDKDPNYDKNPKTSKKQDTSTISKSKAS